MPDVYEILRGLVSAVQPLSEEDWSAFADAWQPFDAGRKTVLTRSGEKERWLYFVTEGAQRIYYLDEEEREATLVFTYAPSFGGVLDAFLLGTPSRYNYETLTASRFLRVSYERLQELMAQRPAVARFVQRGTAGSMSGLLERMAELQCFSAEEKFRKLLQRSPHILNIVPQKYLANYIGMDATNFSKLVNRIRI